MRFFLVWAILLSTAANAQKPEPTRLKVPIVVSDTTLLPRAFVDLGTATAGQQYRLTLELLNTTDKQIVFDSVDAACNCTTIKPQKGMIAPGATFELIVGVNGSKQPTKMQSGGNIFLMNGKQLGLDLAFAFSFNNYAGFAAKTAIVEWDKKAGNDVTFQVPIMIGDRITDDDIDLSFTGMEATPKFSINRVRSVLHVDLAIDPAAETKAMFGQILMANLATSATTSCRVVIEPVLSVKIFPKLLRFVSDDDGNFVSIFYVSPHNRSRSIESVTARIGNQVFPCERQSKLPMASRYKLVVKSDVVADNSTCEVSVRLDDSQVVVSLPCRQTNGVSCP